MSIVYLFFSVNVKFSDSLFFLDNLLNVLFQLLNYSCAQESSIVPLLSMKPSSVASLPIKRAPLHALMDDRASLRRCVMYITSRFMDGNGRIFEILEQLLFWYSKNCFCIVITDHLREVLLPFLNES